MRRIFEQKRQPNNKLLENIFFFSLSGIVFVCFGENESHWYIYVYRTTCSMFINAFHARLNKLRMRTGHQTSSYAASQPVISPPVQINSVSACCCFRGDWAVWKMCYSSSTHTTMGWKQIEASYCTILPMEWTFPFFVSTDLNFSVKLQFSIFISLWNLVLFFFGTDFSPHTI